MALLEYTISLEVLSLGIVRYTYQCIHLISTFHQFESQIVTLKVLWIKVLCHQQYTLLVNIAHSCSKSFQMLSCRPIPSQTYR